MNRDVENNQMRLERDREGRKNLVFVVEIKSKAEASASATKSHTLSLLNGITKGSVRNSSSARRLPKTLSIRATNGDTVHNRNSGSIFGEDDVANFAAPSRCVEAKHPIRVIPWNVLENHAVVVPRLQHLVWHSLVHVAKYLR